MLTKGPASDALSFGFGYGGGGGLVTCTKRGRSKRVRRHSSDTRECIKFEVTYVLKIVIFDIPIKFYIYTEETYISNRVRTLQCVY